MDGVFSEDFLTVVEDTAAVSEQVDNSCQPEDTEGRQKRDVDDDSSDSEEEQRRRKKKKKKIDEPEEEYDNLHDANLYCVIDIFDSSNDAVLISVSLAGNHVIEMEFSSDSSVAVVATDRKVAVVVNLSSSDESEAACIISERDFKQIDRLAVHPDAALQKAFCFDYNGVHCIDLNSAEVVWSRMFYMSVPHGPVFTPSGDLIVFGFPESIFGDDYKKHCIFGEEYFDRVDTAVSTCKGLLLDLNKVEAYNFLINRQFGQVMDAKKNNGKYRWERDMPGAFRLCVQTGDQLCQRKAVVCFRTDQWTGERNWHWSPDGNFALVYFGSCGHLIILDGCTFTLRHVVFPSNPFDINLLECAFNWSPCSQFLQMSSKKSFTQFDWIKCRKLEDVDAFERCAGRALQDYFSNEFYVPKNSNDSSFKKVAPPKSIFEMIVTDPIDCAAELLAKFPLLATAQLPNSGMTLCSLLALRNDVSRLRKFAEVVPAIKRMAAVPVTWVYCCEPCIEYPIESGLQKKRNELIHLFLKWFADEKEHVFIGETVRALITEFASYNMVYFRLLLESFLSRSVVKDLQYRQVNIPLSWVPKNKKLSFVNFLKLDIGNRSMIINGLQNGAPEELRPYVGWAITAAQHRDFSEQVIDIVDMTQIFTKFGRTALESAYERQYEAALDNRTNSDEKENRWRDGLTITLRTPMQNFVLQP